MTIVRSREELEPVIVTADEGKAIDATPTGALVTIKFGSDATNGSFCVFESRRSQGDTRGPGIHAHPGFDEVFYVLEGEYEITIDGDQVLAIPGTAVFVPRSHFHTFAATGRAESKMLHFVTPGGFEHYFEDSMASSQPGAAASKYGIVFKDEA
ncbi:MAG: cupin domain-containing protein [Actinomycetota bacterium]|nr:cupin domain-containing protein [Actinomycetota bacterium]